MNQMIICSYQSKAKEEKTSIDQNSVKCPNLQVEHQTYSHLDAKDNLLILNKHIQKISSNPAKMTDDI